MCATTTNRCRITVCLACWLTTWDVRHDSWLLVTPRSCARQRLMTRRRKQPTETEVTKHGGSMTKRFNHQCFTQIDKRRIHIWGRGDRIWECLNISWCSDLTSLRLASWFIWGWGMGMFQATADHNITITNGSFKKQVKVGSSGSSEMSGLWLRAAKCYNLLAYIPFIPHHHNNSNSFISYTFPKSTFRKK